MRITRSTLVLPCLATTLSGAWSLTSTVSLSSSKTGLSAIFERMMAAAIVTTRLLQNTARQPQLISMSSGSCWASTHAPAPRTPPRAAPTMTKEESLPRWPRGEVSVSRVAPPDCSAPAPKPCRNRHSTRRIGAKTPIVRKSGMHPMAKVAPPIRNSVVTMTHFRPSFSP